MSALLRAALRVEERGGDIPRHLNPRGRPWLASLRVRSAVWRLQAAAGGREVRVRVAGRTDWSEADDLGRRGVYTYYLLPPGVYEVEEPTGWCTTRRYRVCSAGGALTEVGR